MVALGAKILGVNEVFGGQSDHLYQGHSSVRALDPVTGLLKIYLEIQSELGFQKNIYMILMKP